MSYSLRRLKLFFPHKAFYKVPYLVPPWKEEEMGLLWDFFLRNKQLSGNNFEEEIKKHYKVSSNLIFFDAGRQALKTLLKNLSFPLGSEIIIPVLCCSILVRVIKECGLVASLADIGEDLCLTVDSIRKVVSTKTKGVILVHAGGAAASEYTKIVEFCKKNGLFLIDNAAQAWGNQIDGVWLGGMGNAGIVSFGLGKSTFGMGGGMLISNLRKIDDMGEQKNYSKFALMAFYLRYMKRGYTAPWFMCADKLNRKSENCNPKNISYFDKAIQHSLFKKIDTLIKERATISLEIISMLDKKPISFPQRNNLHVWTKLIIRLPEKLRNALERHLFMNRIETEDYYYPLHLKPDWKPRVKSNFSGYAVAEEAYKELLVLPNSPSLTLAHLNYLYGIIEKFKKQYL